MDFFKLPKKKLVIRAVAVFTAVVIVTAVKTSLDIEPFPDSLRFEDSEVRKVQILDRAGIPLTFTYQNKWNIHDYKPLHEIPVKLQEAFIMAEDKRFFSHNGVDWLGRANAMRQNVAALSFIRGASTITEQTVRMLHPRPRTIWSRWIEGMEAKRLEKKFSKAEILEFYLNQAPYAAKRRGVAQAANYYFNRDLDTLSVKEMFTIATLVRSPARMDPRKNPSIAERRVEWLAKRMLDKGLISESDYSDVSRETLSMDSFDIPAEAPHFANYVYGKKLDRFQSRGRIATTLDAGLQKSVKNILDNRLRGLRQLDVTDGAVLVVDHRNSEVIAWVNGGGYSEEERASQIDAITAPRQPGSTLKPLLYAMALEKGWTAATMINDSPLALPVGSGLHAFHNYSRTNYGVLRLREALGNSLNIPAIRTVQFVGTEEFTKGLRNAGVESLTLRHSHYGEGLALGNGEVTLLELVQAYSAIAEKGVFRPLIVIQGEITHAHQGKRIFGEESASLISDILSDPSARRLEFGNSDVLRLPVETAVKTGTSTDYRDAWAIGFSSRYTVGVWMGNLDRKPMKDVTGSRGPALVLRSIFAELNRRGETSPLFLSPKLKGIRICRETGNLAASACPSVHEWFKEGTEPETKCAIHGGHRAEEVALRSVKAIRLLQPTEGLMLAMDPRIPDEMEKFAFLLPEILAPDKIEWIVDGEIAGTTISGEGRFLWELRRGGHSVKALLYMRDSALPLQTETVTFLVK